MTATTSATTTAWTTAWEPSEGSSALIRTARDRGLRVIIDLVVNHTSDQHPWFRKARASKASPYRDFYVWVDEPPKQKKSDVVFPDAEDSIWAWDEKAGQWYLHHFYSHQPELNISNPAVRDEIAKIAGLLAGVGGRRLPGRCGAVPAGRGRDPWRRRPGSPRLPGRLPLLHRPPQGGRRCCSARSNLPAKPLRDFFGDQGDELQLLFNFPVMETMYLSLARQDAGPLAKAIEATEQLEDCQFANFVRNHDELILDQLTEKERQEVFDAFGPDPDMQLFGRGLRRRLPTMLDGDQQRIRMVYSLMFSLPGTPVLFYGEEIGMGENLEIEGRVAVRSPMQWTDEPNAGLLTRQALTVDPPRDRRDVRTHGGERRRAASRPGLPAQLDGAADPAPARDARDRVGRVEGARTHRLPRRAGPSQRLGRSNVRRRSTT